MISMIFLNKKLFEGLTPLSNLTLTQFINIMKIICKFMYICYLEKK